MNLSTDLNLQKKFNDIPGWLSIEEGLLLYFLTKKLCQMGSIVEIGSFLGKSTCFIASALKEKSHKKVFAIDPHKGMIYEGKKDYPATYIKFLKNIHKFKLDKYVCPIRKTSQEAAINWNKPISLLFIDGLHEYNQVKNDVEVWMPYVKSGGVIAFHDAFTSFQDVFQALSTAVLSKHSIRFISFANSIIYIVIGTPKNSKESIISAYNKLLIFFCIAIWRFFPQTLGNEINRLIKKMIIKIKVFEDGRGINRFIPSSG